MTEPVPVAVNNLAAALRAIADREFLASDRHQWQQWQHVVEGAHPDIIEFTRVFIARVAKEHGVPLFPHNMVRTKAEQDRLFVQGVTKARGGSSPHNYGCAVDIIHSRKAWDLHRDSWLMLGHVGAEIGRQKGIKLVWGGDWKSDGGPLDWDPAHWELADWREIKSGYPDWTGVPAWVGGSRQRIRSEGQS